MEIKDLKTENQETCKYLVELPHRLKFSALDVVYDINYVSEHYESKAKVIWVITTNLELDLNNDEFFQAVSQNFKEKRHYTYILPEGKEDYEERYNKKYEEYIGQFNFVYISEETFDLFEEIVIYDPDDIHNRSGFVLITISNDAKLYIKISNDNLVQYIDKLRLYFRDLSDLKKIAQYFQIMPEIKNNENLTNEFGRLFNTPVSIIQDYNNFISNLQSYGISNPLLEDIKTKLSPFRKANE